MIQELSTQPTKQYFKQTNATQMNILLADDDLDDCLFFKKALNELPLTANLKAVHDGDQLMQHLTDEATELPNVLFLDLNMPRKNGFECLSEIKQNNKLKDLPVVIFSTTNSRDTITLLFNTGAHIYIRKPGDIAQLKQVIQHALPMATEKLISNNQVKYILNA